jgi:hypothetical protein
MHDRISSNPPPTPRAEAMQLLAVDDFVSEERLRLLVARGLGRCDGCLLELRDGRRFAMLDAVRIIGHVTQETDPFGMIGMVLTLGSLLRRGFTLSAGRMMLGRHVWDLEHGFLLEPMAADPDASGINPVVK